MESMIRNLRVYGIFLKAYLYTDYLSMIKQV